jgi:hypothetical protein
MANESIRIRTTPGVDKNIRIELNQDFDFLEILSLKISQEDLYQPFCANYGVVVGRVIANKGFGIPNAKVSIFIPITDEDKKNELIKDLYPFKNPYQKNKDGIRYNLLLSKATCALNVGVGTFPTKEEVLDNDIVLEVFDKYYKYTTKTNFAGDFMIFGVPVGQQTLHMDLDMSDIGAVSVRPYELIGEGFPEKLFASKSEFKKSTNLDSLPQIKTGNKGIDVIPFWGDSETCEVGITRADFDSGLEIKPTALFFGSIFTDSGKMALNKGCNPKNDMGEEDNLRTGEGRIEMIRVSEIDTLNWVNNSDVIPVSLEDFSIDGGELIDEDGVFAFPVPMNIGYVITDEFGNLIPSPDTSIGVATKGMYRFKMNFTQPADNPKFRTAHMLFPSFGRDFGGTLGAVNGTTPGGTEDQRFTNDISAYSDIKKDFQLFEWKQLYTIAHYIKKYKKGGNRFSHIGIKNTDVSSETNLFPFTTAIWKFDIIYYIIAFLVDIMAFFIKLIIILISFCIGICIHLTLGVTIFKVHFSWEIINWCKEVCPFNFLADLFPTLPSGSGHGFFLPCDGGGPDGDGYEIDLNNCNNGASFCSPDPCSANDIQIGVTGTDISTNICLQTLEDWKCCVKLNVAENRNVIRRVFNDAWVFGTAYLFQFKYKKKNNGKEKFCGPGADHVRGDNYKSNKCCIDTDANNQCDRCLLRGPHTTLGHSYTGVGNYHEVWHNSATNDGDTGATDIGDIIYCNALLSTKIVSLGRIELCEETIEQIQNAISANNALRQYAQSPQFYTGTFYENGWDADFWVNFLKESSYEDPREVLNYLASLKNCKLKDMFHKGGGCHEYEMLDYEFFFMKEVSKIYTDIDLAAVALSVGSEDRFNPTGDGNPFADVVNIELQDAATGIPAANGGFEVVTVVGNRFSPCGGGGNCYPGSNWNGNTTWPGLASPPHEDLSGNAQAFDRITTADSRNNINTKSNIPYYYFGINPGKTAINKLKKGFFVEK